MLKQKIFHRDSFFSTSPNFQFFPQKNWEEKVLERYKLCFFLGLHIFLLTSDCAELILEGQKLCLLCMKFLHQMHNWEYCNCIADQQVHRYDLDMAEELFIYFILICVSLCLLVALEADYRYLSNGKLR